MLGRTERTRLTERADRTERGNPAARAATAASSERIVLAGDRIVTLRPVRPDDAERQAAFVRALSPQARRWRFHGPVAELPATVIRYMTEVDLIDHWALLALSADGEQVAEARWVRREAEHQTADFAIAVADAWQGVGLGSQLLQRLADSAAERGIQRLHGDILADNRHMLKWLRRRGWQLADDPFEASTVSALRSVAEPPQLRVA